MTKEECIALLDRYANYNGIGIQNLEGCREAMLKAVELLSQPSLPSDIDDAAKKIVIQLHPSMEDSAVLGDRLTMGDLVELVKAGVAWRDEQMKKPYVLLTEDILEKNGFKPDNGSALSWSLQDDLGDTTLKLFKISNAFVLPTVGMTIAIQYVHELQMLFELCGIKRQIKI